MTNVVCKSQLNGYLRAFTLIGTVILTNGRGLVFKVIVYAITVSLALTENVYVRPFLQYSFRTVMVICLTHTIRLSGLNLILGTRSSSMLDARMSLYQSDSISSNFCETSSSCKKRWLDGSSALIDMVSNPTMTIMRTWSKGTLF